MPPGPKNPKVRCHLLEGLLRFLRGGSISHRVELVGQLKDVRGAEIGNVTNDGMMRVRDNGSIAAEIPAKPLAEEAPLYEREAKRLTTESKEDIEVAKEISMLSVSSVVESLKLLMTDPTIASKN